MKLLFALLIWLVSLSVNAAPADDSAIRVEAVEARLFLAETGTFSDPVGADSELWNVIIGNNPSHATLVKVLVAGPAGSYPSKAFVAVAVIREHRRGKAVVLRQSLGRFDGDGHQYVAFWLSETGCEEIEVSARVGKKGALTALRIPFECGE